MRKLSVFYFSFPVCVWTVLFPPKCIFHAMDGHRPRFVIYSMLGGYVYALDSPSYTLGVFVSYVVIVLYDGAWHTGDAAIFDFFPSVCVSVFTVYFIFSLRFSFQFRVSVCEQEQEQYVFIYVCVRVYSICCHLLLLSLDVYAFFCSRCYRHRHCRCCCCCFCWSFRYLWPLSERKMSIEEIQTMKNDTKRNCIHSYNKEVNSTDRPFSIPILCPARTFPLSFSLLMIFFSWFILCSTDSIDVSNSSFISKLHVKQSVFILQRINAITINCTIFWIVFPSPSTVLFRFRIRFSIAQYIDIDTRSIVGINSIRFLVAFFALAVSLLIQPLQFQAVHVQQLEL